MAKLVFEAAVDGDRMACDILEWGGRYLGEMVNGVAAALEMQGEEFDVVMAGSVFKGRSPVLADALRTVVHRVCPWARTVMPNFEPVVGTLLMGMDLDIKVTDEIYETLSRELELAEHRYQVRFKAE